MGMMHGRPTGPRILGLLLASGLAAAAIAEPPPQGPSTQPDPTQPGKPMEPVPRATLPRIIVSPSTAPALEPVRPNVPPSAAADLTLGTSPPLLREGAFVSNASAQLVRGKSGRWYAIFDPDASGVRLPPMIVLEHSNLAAMERVVGRGGADKAATRMRLIGRVLVYRDRNFLLPTAPPILERPAPVDPDANANAASRAASAAAASANAPKPEGDSSSKNTEPSIEQIVAELDKAVGNTGTRRSIPEATAPGAEAGPGEGGSEASVTPGFLTARRARVIRNAEGAPMAVFDSGASGRTEGPMILMPCQNLTAIENAMDSGNESLTFTLTGEVHVYKGRRYLLPTMYQVNRPMDNVMPAH
jgi:hypothetical protein